MIKRCLYLALVCALELLSAADWNILIFNPKFRIGILEIRGRIMIRFLEDVFVRNYLSFAAPRPCFGSCFSFICITTKPAVSGFPIEKNINILKNKPKHLGRLTLLSDALLSAFSVILAGVVISCYFGNY
jgi:hypothetical protein